MNRERSDTKSRQHLRHRERENSQQKTKRDGILYYEDYIWRAGKRRCADTHTLTRTRTQESTHTDNAMELSTQAFHEAEEVSRVCGKQRKEIEEKGSGRNPAALRPLQMRSPIQSPLLSFYSPRRGGRYSPSYHHYSLPS